MIPTGHRDACGIHWSTDSDDCRGTSSRPAPARRSAQTAPARPRLAPVYPEEPSLEPPQDTEPEQLGDAWEPPPEPEATLSDYDPDEQAAAQAYSHGPVTEAENTEPERFTNYRIEETEGKNGRRETVRIGLPLHAIRDNLLQRTGGWPKRVGEMLFAQGDDFQEWHRHAPGPAAACPGPARGPTPRPAARPLPDPARRGRRSSPPRDRRA